MAKGCGMDVWRVLSVQLDGMKAEVIDGAARIRLPEEGGHHEVRVMPGD